MLNRSFLLSFSVGSLLWGSLLAVYLSAASLASHADKQLAETEHLLARIETSQ